MLLLSESIVDELNIELASSTSYSVTKLLSHILAKLSASQMIASNYHTVILNTEFQVLSWKCLKRGRFLIG